MHYKAVVVGAGPAGIAVVGNLLEHHRTPILWVNDEFEGGRLNKRHRQVPSVSHHLQTSPNPNAITQLKSLDQETTCHIADAGDMCLMLTKGLAKLEEVTMQTGYVTDAVSTKDGHWTVRVNTKHRSSPNNITASAELLVLCTSSSPATPPVPIKCLQDVALDEGLDPALLSNVLPSGTGATIAVIGASHSAILVLMNLCNLASITHLNLRIRWFTRHALRYAEERNGTIIRDNTGLKGDVATWARANLEDQKLSKSSVAKYLQKISTTAESEYDDYLAHLPGCTHVIQAVGFKRNPLPKLTVNGSTLQVLKHICATSSFEDENGAAIQGLYGAGIAWPEKVVDSEGNVEYAVGLAKFMRYLKRVVPAWTGTWDSQTGSLHLPDSVTLEEEDIVAGVQAVTGHDSRL